MEGQENNLLLSLLRTQEEIRILEQDDLNLDLTDHDPAGRHLKQGVNGRAVGNSSYVAASSASLPEGAPLVLSPSDRAQDVAWADFHRPAQTPEFTQNTCANGTDCLDDNFCFSWYDCDPCQWCENNVCVDRNPDRECSADWECPCPPSEDQWYMCVESRCALKCETNEDCPEGEVCDPDDFFCKPGCTSDEECDPSNANAAPDAIEGSFCVNAECVTPCEIPVLCNGPSDRTTCGEGQVCLDKELRAPGDPAGPLYECVSGCFDDNDCKRCFTDDDDNEICFDELCLDNQCQAPCKLDSDCATQFGEGCVEGKCEAIGETCLSDSDCKDQICNEDGRCTSGCRTADDCKEDCAPESECADLCGPDPTCTCTDFYSGEDCGTSLTENWRDECPRDPACLAACPKDPECEFNNARNWKCDQSNNQCFVECQDGKCSEGYTPQRDEESGKCSCAWKGGSNEQICEITETCDEDADGNIQCVQTEKCLFISPVVDDEFFGCDCGETCTQKGQCAPAVCNNDEECESCSYCRNGVCVPGCDDENPCGPGECCQTDGKCHLQCSTDSMCPGNEMCLEGGCCGQACDPIVPCVNSLDCAEGQRCNGDKICEDGCNSSDDCFDDEICFQQECYLACISSSDCGDNETCNSDGFCETAEERCDTDNDCPAESDDEGNVTPRICSRGYCKSGCRTDSNCATGELCIDQSCKFVCISNSECKANDLGDKCEKNSDAKRAAKRYYAGADARGLTKEEKQRWKQKSEEKRTGYCTTKAEESEELEGRTGCYCYEECDERGKCERTVCKTTADCECESCLTDGKCGPCTQDADCPGVQVCDFDEECDEDGENCVQLKTGTCGLPCIPEEDCGSDSQCPEGTFCYNDPYYDAGTETVCDDDGANCRQETRQRSYCSPGCRDDDGCLPGEGCRDGSCFKQCVQDGECNTENERCRSGLCQNVGYKCETDADCPAELGQCYSGKCIEDLRCEVDGDCSSSDVCTDGQCRPGERCESNAQCQNTCETWEDCKRKKGSNFECDNDNDCGDGQECLPFDYNSDCDEEGENCTVETRMECGYRRPKCKEGLCFNENPDDTRFCDDGLCKQGEACDSDDDCNFPDSCYFGVCKPYQRCSGRSQCLEGEFCDQGYCLPDDRCANNKDCFEGFFCNRSGRCQEDEQNQSSAYAIGCPDDCSQICTNQFRCEPIPCQKHDECPCNVCDKTTSFCVSECERDAQCGPGYRCDKKEKACVERVSCNSSADCPGGNCDANGFCDNSLPSCLTDSDCDRGVCIDGECLECRVDPDCSRLYPGIDGMICFNNVCETPCYTGLSDGDCFLGLFYGDLCANCPDSCPEGAGDCVLDGTVCGEVPVFNPITGETEYQAIECQSCQKSCSSDSNCFQESYVDEETGETIIIPTHLCEYDEVRDGKFCVYADGSCTTNSDCARFSALDGELYYCQEFQCEIGDLCVGNSDCETGEVCEDGVCVAGPDWNGGSAECTADIDCGVGYKCSSARTCEFICGPEAEAFVCRPPNGRYDEGIACPEGYNCNNATNLCSRAGYDAIGQYMLGCSQGQTCARAPLGDGEGREGIGACMPLQGQPGSGSGGGGGGGSDDDDDDNNFDCRDASDCNGELQNAQQRTEWYCNNGRCKEDWVPEYTPAPGEKIATDPDRRDDDKVQDICEQQNKCCGDNGFCEPCGCSDEYPCTGTDECCDRESGQCISIDVHPNTRYGSPGRCSLDPIFCEVLLPAGDDGTRSTISPLDFEGELYNGCEIIEDAFGNQRKKCWEGGPLSPSQISTLMAQECSPWENKEECDCDKDIPTSDECFSDQDCGFNGKCISKTYTGDACCPLVNEEGDNFQTWNICLITTPDEPRVASCITDNDCTECETCEGSTVCPPGDKTCVGRTGQCRVKCDELCPCGGVTSYGSKCPTCEEKWGDRCVESYTTEIGEPTVDPDTGETIPGKDTCGCRVMSEKECCADFKELVDTTRKRDGCQYLAGTDPDGANYTVQVDYCADFEADICAECLYDWHCQGTAACKGYKCVKQCGQEDATGYDGDCTCCTKEGECKEVFQTWSETRSARGGEQTRACACTENGIDCQPWQDQDGCYEWYLSEGGDGEEGKAERARLEQEIAQAENAQADLDLAVDNAAVFVGEAQLALTAAQAEAEQACELAPICEDAIYGYQTRCENFTNANNTLNSLNADQVRLEERFNTATEAVAQQEIVVDGACPGPDCTSETERLLDLQEELRVIEEEELPALLDQIDQAEVVKDNAQADLEAWETILIDACPIESANPTDCIGYDPASDGSCQAATEALETAQIEYDNAILNASNAEIAANNNRFNIAELQRQYDQTPYKPPVWSQRRKCSCCIDGECRDEEECTFGTCYICQMEPENPADRNKYRAQLYNRVNPAQETCSGCKFQDGRSADGHKDCPDTGGTNDMGGPTAVYFENKTECVKYKCEDGIRLHQELCYGYQSSWYDYCIGSVIGCLFSDTNEEDINYWNGYDYNIACPLAGTWAYNDESDAPANPRPDNGGIVPIGGGNWVQMNGKQDRYDTVTKSACAYPNPIGDVGGNWLPIFPDLTDFHPCCNKSDVYSECDPLHPNCQTKWEILYEAGAPDLKIKRLGQQIEALERGLENLADIERQLTDLKVAKEEEKQQIEDAIDALETGEEQLKEEISRLEAEIIALEAEITAKEEEVEGYREDFDTAKEQVDEISDERNALIAERDVLQAEKDALTAQADNAQQNAENVQLAKDQKLRELNQVKLDIQSNHSEQINEFCVAGWSGDDPIDCSPDPCAGDGTIVCFDLDQELQPLYEERDNIMAEIVTLDQEKNQYQQEADEYRQQAADVQLEINPIQTQIDSLYRIWVVRNAELQTASDNLNRATEELAELRRQLIADNNQLDFLRKQLEAAETGSLPDLVLALENVEEVLNNIEESFAFVEETRAEYNTAIEEKSSEKARLEAENNVPVVPVATTKPDQGRTLESIRQEYAETVQEKQEKEQDKWYPET